MSATPFGFSAIPGMQTRLWNYVRRDRVHPALILGGPEKETKFALAKGLAKYFLCKQKPSGIAFCGTCSACRRVDKELHPDLLVIREEGEDTIKIETIRQVCSQMALSYMEGPAKVCIVEECHRMTTASANAFLKTLEEPGEDRYFLLLTSQPGSLLPTIQSRCLSFTVPPDEEATRLETQSSPEFLTVLDNYLQTRNAAVAVAAVGEKENVLKFVQFLEARLRETLLAKETGTRCPPLFNDAHPSALLEKYEATLRVEGRLRSNANYGLMLEDLLLSHF